MGFSAFKETGATSASLRLYPHLANDPSPLLALAPPELAHRLRRPRAIREPAEAADARIDLGNLQELGRLAIYPLDHFLRRPGRRRHGEPPAEIDARQRVRNRGQVFGPREAPLGSDADHAQLPGLDERIRRRRRDDDRLD